MAKKKKQAPQGANKGTMAVVALICLCVGFYAGMVFQGGRAPQMNAAMAPGSAPQDQGMASQVAQAEAETRAHPDDASAWIHLGNLYFDTDQPEKSVTAYEKSLALQPGNPNVLTDQGVMFRRLGEFDQALACFNKAIAADSGHIIANFNKSIVLLHDKNDLPGAIAALEALAAANPKAVVPGGRNVAEVLQELKSGHGLGPDGGQGGAPGDGPGDGPGNGPGAGPGVGPDAGPGFLR